VVKSFVDNWDVAGISLGCAGPMDKSSGKVSPINIRAWRNFPLRQLLSSDFKLPVFLENDVKALAVGEYVAGKAKGAKNFIAGVVSTGIGGGIILDGKLLNGHYGNAGHLGHVIVEPKGRKCGCGAYGCVEAEASGSAIEKITGKSAKLASLNIKRRTGKLVGRALASVANLLDLELAVIGGSVALGFGKVFFDEANKEVKRLCRLEFSRSFHVMPISSKSTSLIGAAAIAFSELKDKMES
jgi:glucokinase